METIIDNRPASAQACQAHSVLNAYNHTVKSSSAILSLLAQLPKYQASQLLRLLLEHASLDSISLKDVSSCMAARTDGMTVRVVANHAQRESERKGVRGAYDVYVLEEGTDRQVPVHFATRESKFFYILTLLCRQKGIDRRYFTNTKSRENARRVFFQLFPDSEFLGLPLNERGEDMFARLADTKKSGTDYYARLKCDCNRSIQASTADVFSAGVSSVLIDGQRGGAKSVQARAELPLELEELVGGKVFA